MRISFILPSKRRNDFVFSGIEEYLKRLSAYCDCKLILIPEEKLPPNPSTLMISKALQSEALKILKQIKREDVVYLADVHSPLISSEQFAKLIITDMETTGNFAFVVGSSYGFDETLKERANRLFSLSSMTFTHTMAMLLLTEQVYRSFKIINGETYDK